jgi:hypothetical protein
MVDPIAIIAAICGIITTLKALHDWWHLYREKRLTGGIYQNTNVEINFRIGFVNIWRKYNRIAALLGMKLSSRFTDKSFLVLLSDSSSLGGVESLMHDLSRLRSRLGKLQSGLSDLRQIGPSPSHHHLIVDDNENGFDEIKKFAKSAKNIEKEIELVLDRMTLNDLPAEKDIIAGESQTLKQTNVPRRFCENAKLFQTGYKDDKNLSALAEASPSKSGWGYICTCCGLEVAHYPAVRLSHDGRALDSSVLLTASHLVAFKTLQDRRAFYRCLPCYKKRRVIEFQTALAYESHMEQHPGFTLLSEHDEDRIITLMAKESEYMDGINTEDGGINGPQSVNVCFDDNNHAPQPADPTTLQTRTRITFGKFNEYEAEAESDGVSDMEENEHQIENMEQESESEIGGMEMSPGVSKSATAELPAFEVSFPKLELEDNSHTIKHQKKGLGLGHTAGSLSLNSSNSVAPVAVEPQSDIIHEMEREEVKFELTAQPSSGIRNGSRRRASINVGIISQTPNELSGDTPIILTDIPTATSQSLPENVLIENKNLSVTHSVKGQKGSNSSPAPQKAALKAIISTQNPAPYQIPTGQAVTQAEFQKADMGIFKDGVYFLMNKQTVIGQQLEMPIDLWIRLDKGLWDSKADSKAMWKMKSSSTAEILYA